jgi:hypothetical protein
LSAGQNSASSICRKAQTWSREPRVKGRVYSLPDEVRSRLGSPNASEIELSHVLINEWPNVVKWLKNFDLLRSVGLESLILRV